MKSMPMRGQRTATNKASKAKEGSPAKKMDTMSKKMDSMSKKMPAGLFKSMTYSKAKGK